ncbi:MAG: M20/M25/M40 family metallo-hydrolase [Firmicutes bacterium]|nr:M20/M25/M40 family metallo-hydrolase [Bacillota bacterium]
MKNNRVIDLFLELVQIDSISLAEREMADRLSAELKSLGGEVHEDNTAKKIGGQAGNIIGYFKGNDNYPAILLSAHMDRVEPGRGIKPVIRGDYIYSSGNTVLGGDDLIGVSAILEVIRVLKERRIEHGDLKVVFSVAEELGLLGARELDPVEISGLDLGIVLDVDGDVGTIVYKAPAQLKFNAVIKGKSAHAGMHPEEGINAIKISSKAISDIKLGQIDEETTANIGVIRGGKAINIVPEIVELEGEVRSHNDHKLEKQLKHMKEIIKQAVEKYGGSVKYNIEKLYPGFELPLESDIIRLIAYSMEGIKIPIIYMVSGGGSDANIFNKLGLPTINLGVGMEKVHTSNETVCMHNMIKLVELMIKVIKDSRGYY